MPVDKRLENIMTEVVNTAIIGPPDHVDGLRALAEAMPEMRATPYPYEDEAEAGRLFRDAARTNAVAVFSGPKPFHVAQQEVGPVVPMVYVPFTGATLYRAVFLHGRDSGQDYRMSIDTVTEHDVSLVLNDLGLAEASCQVLPYEPGVERDDLIRFHTEAYQRGEVAGALTTLQSAYEALRARGVPAIRVEHARSSMISTLRGAGLLGRAAESSKHALVVGVFAHDPDDAAAHELRRRIREFVRDIDGMVARDEDGEVMFFGSRGLLEHVTVNFERFPILTTAASRDSKLQLGVGLGPTVNQAHSHAVAALAQAKEHDGNVAFVVSSGRKLLGPIGDGAAGSYRVQVSDPDRLALAREVGTGPVMLERFGDALARWDAETFTAEDIAHLLHRDVRTARRILAKLRSARVVEVVGKAQLHGRGKPRQVYRLHQAHRGLVQSHRQPSSATSTSRRPRRDGDVHAGDGDDEGTTGPTRKESS